MKKRVLTGMLLASWALFAAIPEPLLKADFDGNVSGGKISGKVKPEYVQGVQGKAIKLSDAQVVFPKLAKLSAEEGSATIWVRPVNWKWTKKQFVFLLSNGANIRLYKYHIPLGLLVSYGMPGKHGVNHTYANYDWSKFQNNTWMALGITWSRKQHLLAIYANGEKLASSKLLDSMIPQALGDWIVNASPFAPRDRKNATEFDMLRIYDRALTGEEMAELYQKEMPNSISFQIDQLRPTRFNLPVMPNAPKVDGEFDEREWAGAAKLGGFTALGGLDIANTSDVYAGVHKDKLYFCYIFQLPGATQLTAVCTKRDSSVYADDAAELVLRTDKMKSGEFYQGIFNSNCAIYDQHNGKKSWNGNWQVKTSMYEGYLNIEIAIPLSELKTSWKKDMEWGINFARDRIVGRDILFSSVSPFASARLFFDLGTAKFVADDLIGRLSFNYHQLFNRKLEFVYQVLNRSAQKRNVEFLVEILSPEMNVIESKKITAVIAPAGMHRFEYTNPLAGIRGAVLRMTAKEPGSKQPFYVQDFPLAFKDEFRIADKTDLQKNEVSIEVDCTSHRLTVNAASVTGKLGKQIVKFSGSPIAKGTFRLAGLAPGDYTIELEFRDKAGKVLLLHKQPYNHIGQPDWLVKHYGEGKGVVWPYTPIKWKNQVFEVWGRSHKFGKNLLPESIVSQKQELLAGSPVLKLTADGREYTLDNFEFTLRENKPELLVMDLKAAAGKVRFTGTVKMEFDGFIWYDLKMTGAKDVTVQDLHFEIPLKKEIAQFYNAHYYSREKRVGRLTEKINLKRYPSIWVGNLDVGLSLMLESFKSWRNKDVNRIFEIDPGKNSALWKINLIDRPVKLDREFNYGFAIEANPAKPKPSWFRSWRLGMMKPHNIMHPWGFDRENTKKYSGSGGFYAPVFKSIEVFRDLLAQYKAKGVDFSVYLNPFLCSNESTEWKIFNKQWNNPYNCYPQCPNSTFTDYITGCIDLLIKNGLKVLYVDSLGAVNCANPLHGCGYIDEETGETVLTWPVRGMRNYMKRLYSMLHPYDGRNQREYFIWGHTSARNCVALNAFLDCFNCGEELENRIVTEPNYVKLYPLDEYQIFYLDSIAGVPMAGANLGRIGPKKDRYHKPYNDQFVMLVLMHDSQIWNGWLDEPYVSTFYEKLDRWGYKDERIKFHSYRKQRIIVSPEKDIHVSIYQLPDRALAIVGNWQKKTRTVKLDIDVNALGSGEDLVFRDLRSGKAVDPAAVTLPEYNFIMMDIRKK